MYIRISRLIVQHFVETTNTFHTITKWILRFTKNSENKERIYNFTYQYRL